MEDEYQSDFTDKIKNLDDCILNNEQKEINKILVRKEKELKIEAEKWQQELKRNTNIYYSVIALISFFLLTIGLAFYFFESKSLRQTALAKNGIYAVLRKLDNKLNQYKKDLVINQKIVEYRNKKYLKILKTDLMEIKTQPKYFYLEIK